MIKTYTEILNESDEYHVASSHGPEILFPSNQLLNSDEQILELLNTPPFSVASTETISLPPFDLDSPMPLEEAIIRRTSTRIFSEQELTLPTLAKLLYLANGVRRPEHLSNSAASRPHFDRNVPNAGGLGSVDLFCIVTRVTGLNAGIYHFDSMNLNLQLCNEGDYSQWLKDFALLQMAEGLPPVLLVLCTSVARLATKYGARAYRLALLDAGHVSNNIYLTATASKLGVCAYNGFVDAELNLALGLDGLDRCAVLCVGIGHSQV